MPTDRPLHLASFAIFSFTKQKKSNFLEGKFKYFNKNQSWNFTVKFEMGKVKKVARKFKFIFDICHFCFLDFIEKLSKILFNIAY